MKWVKFKIKTITEAEDIIISTLYDIGLEGAQIEDKIPLTAAEKEQMFVDILPDGPEDDGIAYLSFFVEEKEDGTLEVNGEPTTREEILENVKAELENLRMFMDIGEGTITVDETEDIDWINNWKQYFHQFYIDELLVIPSWEEVKEEDKDKMILHIDPGTAFGTGMHETTQLCIRQIKKYVTPETQILDVGCGSGILSVAGMLLGAKDVTGVDIDKLAVKVAVENGKLNGFTYPEYNMIVGNLIDRVSGKYSVVTANIVADAIIMLTPDVKKFLSDDAVYIVSGIIDIREDEVLSCLSENGFTIVNRRSENGWVCLECKL